MKKATANQAAKKLISLYKRDCDNADYFRTQAFFDSYVYNWCVNGRLVEADLNEDQLDEIAFAAVEYDGFLSDFNN